MNSPSTTAAAAAAPEDDDAIAVTTVGNRKRRCGNTSAHLLKTIITLKKTHTNKQIDAMSKTYIHMNTLRQTIILTNR